MAVLGKKKLTDLIINGDLLDDYELKNIKSASYDLRIGTIYKDDKTYSRENIKNFDTIKVKPSEIVTMLTLESVKIPLDCVGTVFAINNMSSRGFLILNPGHIDPGYNGPITICAINLSKIEEPLYLEKPIFTLILNKLDKPLTMAEGFQSKFEADKRGRYELELFSKKFSRLSNSFFDIASNHEDLSDLFSKLLNQKWSKIRGRITKFVLTILSLAVGIYAVFNIAETLSPNPLFKGTKKVNAITLEKDSIIKLSKQKDSILEVRNSEIKDYQEQIDSNKAPVTIPK